MKKIVSIALIVVVAALFYFTKKQDQNPSELTVYSYSSFASSWGAGPEVVKEFENRYGIKVSLVDVGDARTLLQRIELEKSNPKADVVIGLDHLILIEATKTTDWKKVSLPIAFASDFPEKKIMYESFVPFDWAPMTFIYREGEVPPPRTFEELSASNYQKSLVLFDPRTSGPGYLFADWLVRSLGADKAKSFLSSLKENILTVTPSWSAGYGLFQKKQARLVFSYVTSAVYHWINDKDLNYKAAEFRDPVPYHIEYVAIPADCHNCEKAEEFVKFMMTPEIQKKIMMTNYMFPTLDGIKDDTEFAKLPKLKIIEIMIAPEKDAVLDVWKSLGQ